MDGKCTHWACIAALPFLLSACGSLGPDQPRLPPKDGPPISRPSMVPDTMLALSKAVPEAGATLVAAGQSNAAPAQVAAPAAPADPPPDPQAVRARALEQALLAWQEAWQSGDADAYVRAYDPRFKGGARTRQAWEKDKRRRLATGGIRVRISEVQWKMVSDDVAEARFLQHYEQGKYRDVGDKTLRLARTDAGWKITQEVWRARKGKA